MKRPFLSALRWQMGCVGASIVGYGWAGALFRVMEVFHA